MKIKMEINMKNKMKNIMNKIRIGKNPVEDEEIIEDIESIKNDPGFDINKKVYGITLLIRAVCLNCNELVEYLLKDPNIDVNHRCDFGLATIFYCSTVSILKLLIDHRNIDVNVQNKDGRTVLHVWCNNSNSEQLKMIRELLIYGRIDLSIKNKDGKTALDIKDKDGRTILDRAIKFKFYDIAKIIIIMSPTNIVLSKDLARRLCEYI